MKKRWEERNAITRRISVKIKTDDKISGDRGNCIVRGDRVNELDRYRSRVGKNFCLITLMIFDTEPLANEIKINGGYGGE